MKKLISIAALLLCSVFISNGQWTYTNLSEPKAFMGVTAHGTKAYFGGGWNGNNVSLVEIYDVVTEEWDTSYDLSVARVVPGGVTCGNLVIFAGGGNLNNWVMDTEVDIFNTQTPQWTVEHLSVARVGVAVASKDSIVIFAGGIIAQPWVTVDVVDIYNTETGEWSTTSLSESRDARAAAVVGDLALFAGGYNGEVLSKRVDIYNFTTNTWSIDSLSVARSWMQAVSIGNKILFAGGVTSSTVASKKVDIYDATSGTWSIDSLSFPRAFTNNTAGAAACGKAFFVGGGNLNLSNLSWTTEYDVIDIYDEATNTWSIDSLSNAIIEHAVVAVEDKLIVAGGKNDSDGLVSTVSIYTCPTSCLPEGITFSTQEQIDNFQVNYPYCTEIEGDVEINGDDITNIDSLNVLTSIGGYLKIDSNDILTSLSGLENIDEASITDLNITNNDELYDCDVWSICQYLIDPGGTVVIENNATECNSIEEVQEHCLTEIEEIVKTNGLHIIPNPLGSSSIITYTLENNSSVELKILDLSGREMITLVNEFQQQGEQRIVFYSDELKPGIYFCVLKTNNGIQTTKMIKL